jgi:hypothetical protein
LILNVQNLKLDLELNRVTETLCTEPQFVISHESKHTLQERIVERKTIVYETLVDPAVIRIAAENLKGQLFTKYVFLRPTPEEVTIVSVEKTYEPFIMITGKYSIDYYRKRTCTFTVDNAVSEVVFGFGRFSSKQVTDSAGKTYKEIELLGEERLQSEAKATLTLDMHGKEASLKQLPSAPSEKNPEEIIAKLNEKQVAPDFELNALRNKVQKRPADLNWIENETFEVTERLVFYTPKFRAVFMHTRTGRERAAEFDGVTGKLIHVGDNQAQETPQ